RFTIADNKAHAQIAIGYLATYFAQDFYVVAFGKRIAKVARVWGKLEAQFVSFESCHACAFQRSYQQHLPATPERLLDLFDLGGGCRRTNLSIGSASGFHRGLGCGPGIRSRRSARNFGWLIGCKTRRRFRCRRRTASSRCRS